MNIKFKGDHLAEYLKNQLTKSPKRTPNASWLRIFSSQPNVEECIKDKVPLSALPVCFYKFTCSCGAGYFWLKKRMLSKRIFWNYPGWLLRGEFEITNRSILESLIKPSSTLLPNISFKLIYVNKRFSLNEAQINNLFTTEVVTINRFKHEFCVER